MILIDSWDCEKTNTQLWLYKANSSELESETQEKNQTKITGRQLEKGATDWIRATLHPQTEIEKNEFGKPELTYRREANLTLSELPFINFSHTLTDAENPSYGKDCWVLWGCNSENQIGVDFERLRPQIEKIKSKFCRPEELEYARLEHTHLLEHTPLNGPQPDREQINSVRFDNSQLDHAQMNNALTYEKITSPEKLLMIWSAKEAMYKAYGKKEIDFREQMKVHEFELNFDQIIEFSGELWGDKHYNFQLFAKWFKPFIAVWAVERKSGQ